MIENIKSLKGYGVYMTGSKYICHPPPTDTDTDYLIFCPTQKLFLELFDILVSKGFKLECGEHYQSAVDNTFFSFRKDDLNLLLTKNKDFKQKHILASELCRGLNVMDKRHRIAIFQAILYGKLHGLNG